MSLLLLGCGFKLRGQSEVMLSSLPVVFVKSEDPYGSLNKIFLEVMKRSGVRVVTDPKYALYVIEMKKAESKIESVGYGFSNQVSMNTVTETLTYRMLGRGGKELIPWRTISTVNSFTINTNQALSGTVIPDYLSETMNRDLVYQLIEQLNAWEFNENQLRPTRRPAY